MMWQFCALMAPMLLQAATIASNSDEGIAIRQSVKSGDTIAIRVHHGGYLALRDTEKISARSAKKLEDKHTFVIEKAPVLDAAGVQKAVNEQLFSGDHVFLRAYNGNYVHVDTAKHVEAKWPDRGPWQRLVVEKVDGGAIRYDDNIFLRANHTGAHIDVESGLVKARFNHFGVTQLMQVRPDSVVTVAA